MAKTDNAVISMFCRTATAITGEFKEPGGREAYKSIQEYLERNGAMNFNPGINLRSFGGQGIDYNRMDFYHLVEQRDTSRIIMVSTGLALPKKDIEHVRVEFTSPDSLGELIAEMRNDIRMMFPGSFKITNDVSISR